MSKTLVIKCDEELFNRWKLIGNRISLQSSIVQNDMEIDITELQEWLQHVDGILKDMSTLIDDTCAHVTKEVKDA